MCPTLYEQSTQFLLYLYGVFSLCHNGSEIMCSIYKKPRVGTILKFLFASEKSFVYVKNPCKGSKILSAWLIACQFSIHRHLAQVNMILDQRTAEWSSNIPFSDWQGSCPDGFEWCSISKVKVFLLWARSQAHVDIVKEMFNGWLKSLDKGDLPSSCKHTKEQRINRDELYVHIWKVPLLFPILWQTQRKGQRSSSYVRLNCPSFPTTTQTTNSYN